MWHYRHEIKDCNLLELPDFIKAADERQGQLVTITHYMMAAPYNPNESSDLNYMKGLRFILTFKYKTWKWW